MTGREPPVATADADGPADADGDGPTPPTAVGRRSLLALAGSLSLGTLAGCGGGADGDGPTTSTTRTTSDAPATTAPGTATSTTRTTTARAVTTESTTTQPTTTEPTTTRPTTVAYDAAPIVAPSSRHAPTDGFASVDWLARGAPEIVRVRSLDASGEGSLRAALEGEGNRVVVFEVGGTIDLAGEGGLRVPQGSGNVYVAGQTAPSPGITVIRGDLVVNAENVAIQHVRVRPGDDLPAPSDALSVGTTGSNVLVDHCSTTWGTDEVMSTGGSEDCGQVTFSHNIVAEALYDSIHPAGPLSKATLIMDHTTDAAMIGNTYANNVGRHPVLKGDTTAVVVNNLVFHYEAAITMAGTEEYTSVASIVGNHYEAGPGKRLIEEASPIPPRAYAADNRLPYGAPLADDTIDLLDEKPVWPGERLSPIPSTAVRAHNLATAGARPADRSPHDERVIATIADGTERIIDSQSEVGGYPALEATERALDPPAPGEGLGSWLVQHTRAVELGESPPS